MQAGGHREMRIILCGLCMLLRLGHLQQRNRLHVDKFSIKAAVHALHGILYIAGFQTIHQVLDALLVDFGKESEGIAQELQK